MSNLKVPNPKHFSLPSGVRVLDRFTIQRGVGIGGFGEVYFAISDAGKEVALKRIQRNLEVELRGVTHCLNLKHPNLLSLHDICRDADEIWWVVMEYVAGPSLRDLLDTHPQGLPMSETLRWFNQAAAGVEHLHQQGLVHRDLKPANLFDDLGVIKVGDYGLSKFISDARRGGQTEGVGTLHYMAPEVGDGKYGHEIDIYALGVILYEMLTGRLPFEGDTSREILHKHHFAQPDLSGIASPYREVIERAMRKDPQQRWPSVAAMSQTLGGLGDVSHPPPCPNPAAPQQHAASYPRQPQPAAPLQPGEPSPTNGWKNTPTEPWGARAEPASRVGRSGFLRELWNDPPLPIRHLTARLVLGRLLLLTLGLLVLVSVWRWQYRIVSSPARFAALLGVVAVAFVIHSSRSTKSGRALFDPPRPPDPPPPQHYPQRPGRESAPPVAVLGRHKQRQLSRSQIRQLRLAELAAKPTSSRLAELAGSCLAAAITVTLCCAFAGWFVLAETPDGGPGIASLAWTGAVALLTAGILLGIGKAWEGREWGGIGWRLTFALVGASIGATAYGLHDYLLLTPSPARQGVGMSLSAPNFPFPFPIKVSGVSSPLVAYVAHFAVLLGCFRWTGWTDPLRRRRLELFWIPVVPVTAWLIHQAIPVYQPWTVLAAGIAVIAIQVAAVWERPRPASHWGSLDRRPIA